MTPDNVSPPQLTNNAVLSVLDYSSWQYTKETLTGVTAVLGGKTYTFYVDVFPKDPGPGRLLDPRDIAAALVSAVNFDADGSGIFYDPIALQSGNDTVEAYCRGAIITVLGRGAGGAGGGAGEGGAPGTPLVDTDTFATATALSSAGAWTALPAAADAKTFDLENIGTEPVHIRRVSAPADVFKINNGFGSTFGGNPSLFEVRSTTVNTQALQIKVRYF